MTNVIDNHQNHTQAEKAVAILANMEPKGIEFVDDDMFLGVIGLPGTTLRDEKKDVCVYDVSFDDRHFVAVDTLGTSFIARVARNFLDSQDVVELY